MRPIHGYVSDSDTYCGVEMSITKEIAIKIPPGATNTQREKKTEKQQTQPYIIILPQAEAEIKEEKPWKT